MYAKLDPIALKHGGNHPLTECERNRNICSAAVIYLKVSKMLDRRAFLGYSVVTAGLLSFEFARASSVPITESPLFRVNADMAYVLSVRRQSASDNIEKHYQKHYLGELPQINVQITKERYSDGVPVRSIVDAEDRLLSGATDMHLEEIAQMTLVHRDGRMRTEVDQQRHLANLLAQRRNLDALPFNLVRAGNRIATRSRRGFGNHLLMHPRMFATLMKSQPVSEHPDFIRPVSPVRIGRWTEVASMHTMRIMLSRDALPPREIVAFYRNVNSGIVDGPAAVVSDGANLSLLSGKGYSDKIFRFAIPI
jgi:hypothetical protein